MMLDRFFYHSFPRRNGAEALDHAISILESIVDRGLLLTPERIEFNELLSTGTYSSPVLIFQKRICFTELGPSELNQHAKQFGEFALEFDIATLRRMGAIPVFYVPLSTVGLEGVASSVLCRLAEV